MTNLPGIGFYGAPAGPPAFVSADTGNAAQTGSTLTWSHVIAAGTDCLVVNTALAMNSNGSTNTITGVTYNGVALTKVTQRVNNANEHTETSIWYLLNPPVGTFNIVATSQTPVDRLFAGMGMDLSGILGIDVFGSNVFSGSNASLSLTPTKPCVIVENVVLVSSTSASLIGTWTGITGDGSVSASAIANWHGLDQGHTVQAAPATNPSSYAAAAGTLANGSIIGAAFVGA